MLLNDEYRRLNRLNNSGGEQPRVDRSDECRQLRHLDRAGRAHLQRAPCLEINTASITDGLGQLDRAWSLAGATCSPYRFEPID
jgi:hypothetical protein